MGGIGFIVFYFYGKILSSFVVVLEDFSSNGTFCTIGGVVDHVWVDIDGILISFVVKIITVFCMDLIVVLCTVLFLEGFYALFYMGEVVFACDMLGDLVYDKFTFTIFCFFDAIHLILVADFFRV